MKKTTNDTATETLTTQPRTASGCSRPWLDREYYKGLPGLLKLLEAVSLLMFSIKFV